MTSKCGVFEKKHNVLWGLSAADSLSNVFIIGFGGTNDNPYIYIFIYFFLHSSNNSQMLCHNGGIRFSEYYSKMIEGLIPFQHGVLFVFLCVKITITISVPEITHSFLTSST